MAAAAAVQLLTTAARPQGATDELPEPPDAFGGSLRSTWVLLSVRLGGCNRLLGARCTRAAVPTRADGGADGGAWR
eukprot:COSAG05_NODE_12803_length_454_cov_0.602817_1_plen_75_part_10